MSRTEKDAPWWYRATWWLPRHLNCPLDARGWHRNTRNCDLPVEPQYPTAPRGVQRSGGCQWWPDWKFRCTCDWCRKPYRRSNRAHDRDFCRVATTEHRAAGTVATEPPYRRPVGPQWCDY